MNNLAYIQWTRKNFPAVYKAAVTQVQRKVSLGGLGDDLLSDVSYYPANYSVSDDISYESGADYPSGNPTANGTDWSGIINSVASAIPKVAGSVVQSKAAWDLINTNSQLAQRGLPLQSSLLSPSAIQQNTTLILGLGALVVVAIALSGKKSHV